MHLPDDDDIPYSQFPPDDISVSVMANSSLDV